MAGDVLSFILFPVRTGLNLAALIAAGLALHASLGVVERNGFGRLRLSGLAACIGIVLLAGGRLLILNVQLGDGSTLFDPDLVALSWLALGPSTLALGGGAMAIAAGIVTSSRIVLGMGSLALAAGFGLTGHTQGLTDPGLAPVAVAFHVLIAGFWVAAPLTLYPSDFTLLETLHGRLERFSRLAVAAIPALIVLGVWLAWRIAGGFAPLFTSGYGWLLLLKLAIALAAMTIGALNKQVVTAKILSDPPTGRRWLRWTLAAEASLFLGAIVAISAATTIAGPGE